MSRRYLLALLCPPAYCAAHRRWGMCLGTGVILTGAVLLLAFTVTAAVLAEEPEFLWLAPIPIALWLLCGLLARISDRWSTLGGVSAVALALGLLALLYIWLTAQTDRRAGVPVDRAVMARDEAALKRLKAEARALAKADGCPETAQCLTAPLGAKPCGGPWEYLVYCAATTDAPALFRKLDEVKRAEARFIAKYGLVSDCAVVGTPAVESVAGACRAAPPSLPGGQAAPR